MNNVTQQLIGALEQTRRSIRVALRRPDTLLIIGGVAVLYTGVYLAAIGHLFLGSVGLGFRTVGAPFVRALQQSGTFLWEPVARFDLWALSFLFSPFNTGLGLLLGVLVGLNLGLAYLAWRQPAACGIRAGSGFLAAIPALLSGSACCAPVLLVVLGIQASGILLVALDVALPIGIALLVGSLVYVGQMGSGQPVR